MSEAMEREFEKQAFVAEDEKLAVGGPQHL
jgi:hypothetical protein